jgi:hypothetical protein
VGDEPEGAEVVASEGPRAEGAYALEVRRDHERGRRSEELDGGERLERIEAALEDDGATYLEGPRREAVRRRVRQR